MIEMLEIIKVTGGNPVKNRSEFREQMNLIECVDIR